MPSVVWGRAFRMACVALVALQAGVLPAGATSRIKDLANIEGVRSNQLIGYGLVVGLAGTGDKLDNAVFTRESLIGMLERLGAKTPAHGDATNLTGGTLLVTPLLAADGEVYAVAQGAVATGAIAARGAAASVSRGVPTAARIANGATVEREVPYRLDKTHALRLGL